MEVYVDDMLVKSKKARDHVANLQECFNVLRNNNFRVLRNDNRNQQLIYFVSKTLVGAEERYPNIEKAALALVITGSKNETLFLGSPDRSADCIPTKSSIASPNLFAHLTKWAIELSEFDIKIKPRIAIKAQALNNFINECTSPRGSAEIQSTERIDSWNRMSMEQQINQVRGREL
ncbi:hypothetical protein CRG98_029913 [Punica granatum]|uniref:Reverse transcriptase RNase H-like domain-containing protein n=1 Tax=Punica granatum TaxID=22663 RepID=A0A2I0J095_PUNGR|nr:hypothetical protein CRG98_029913 [Punica granatum]